mmetsp:Transcript_17810/g.32253  ORF Transcript_17810/g.32253 Transcript_17810/m.32253 type:complete len:629 (+) Transcript_17810:102-1988(+)
MPQVDLLISSARGAVTSARQYRVDVPEGCTIGQLKHLVATGAFGGKVPYAEKLRCRHPLDEGFGILDDSAQVPVTPARICVEGPPSNASLVGLLEIQLKDHQIAASVPTVSQKEAWPPQRKAVVHEVKRLFRPVDLQRDTVASAKRKIAEHRGITTNLVHLLADSTPLEDALRLSDLGRRQIQVRVQVPRVVKNKGVQTGVELNLPLDENDICTLQRNYPDFKGKLPEQCSFWSRCELELFLSTNGRLIPYGMLRAGKTTCELLNRLRKALAEHKVSEAPQAYVAFSRKLAASGLDRDQLLELPTVKSVVVVPRTGHAPEILETPLVLESGTFAAVEDWSLEFWQVMNGRWEWPCRESSPQCHAATLPDIESPVITATIAEYIDYAHLLQEKDPACSLTEAVAHFRVSMDRIPLFSHNMREVLERRVREFKPNGLQDLTMRWVQMLADRVALGWLDLYSEYFKISFAALGCVEQLHKEPNNAHTWLAVIEGRRLYYLFAPMESEKLYERCSGQGEVLEDGHVRSISPVDIFATPSRRFSLFAEAECHSVLVESGETLLIPSGWWWYAVALAPTVVAMHTFYNRSNGVHIVADFQDRLARASQTPGEIQEELQAELKKLREDIELDVED